DAVMVARGCLGNPWVFREIAADLRGEPVPQRPTLEHKREMMVRHLDLYVETFGERRTSTEIRKHLLWYVRGTRAERAFRARMKELTSRDDVLRVIEEIMSDDSALETA
ncbi:MAG: tRNA-dihydrouridine synthase, partial [Myxococcota bacterium]